MPRLVVDPRFPARLRELRVERGLSLRELAKLTYLGKSTLSELEHKIKAPSIDTAQRLDNALQAGGDLARLVCTPSGAGPEGEERLLYAARHPRRLDRATVDVLAELLAGQRRLEDSIGSAPLVTSVLAQLTTIEGLVGCAADDEVRPRLVDVAGQWAHFAGWLCATTGDHAAGHRWYVRAMEWATEAGNPHMAATALSMRGHLAWVRGQTRAMIELSRAAAWQPASLGVRALATQQEGRGLALLGDGPGADAALDRAEDMAAEAAQHRDREPPWLYFYDPAFFALQRGLAQGYLRRHDRAAELLVGGLERLPAEIQSADWIGWYVAQLAGMHAEAGDMDCAVEALEEARQIAEATGAARLAGDVRELAVRLGV